MHLDPESAGRVVVSAESRLHAGCFTLLQAESVCPPGQVACAGSTLSVIESLQLPMNWFPCVPAPLLRAQAGGHADQLCCLGDPAVEQVCVCVSELADEPRERGGRCACGVTPNTDGLTDYQMSESAHVCFLRARTSLGLSSCKATCRS